MTNKDYVASLLENATRRHGENAFSTQMLKRQLASMEWWENIRVSQTHQFHKGARDEASEDPQPGEYREDMHGNPVLTPEERADAEERQEEESANRGYALRLH